jgi:hypothetical protein
VGRQAERVDDHQVAEAHAGWQVFGVEHIAARFEGGPDQQGIPNRQLVALYQGQ